MKIEFSNLKTYLYKEKVFSASLMIDVKRACCASKIEFAIAY